MRSTPRLFRLGSFLLCATLPLTVAAQDLSTALQKTQETVTRPVSESAKGLGRPAFIGAYSAHFVPPLSLQNTDRLTNLIRQKILHLSLHDAILLAVENNLDVEQQRYQLAMADTDLVRAK